MTLKNLRFLILTICFLQTVIAQVKINEYSVSNTLSFAGTTYADNLNNRPDWIELHNASTNSVTISGWYLTNDPDNVTKFKLPATATITANGFLRIWCKEKYFIKDAPGNLHTNFELTQCLGEYILLTAANGTSRKDSIQLNLTQSNHSWGRKPDGAATWKLFDKPSPATTNTVQTAFIDYVATPVFGAPSGFSNSNQLISITCPTPSTSTIYYTTNGSEPTTASSIYTAAITLTTTTVIRAMATTTISGYLSSFMQTNTYFIGQNINTNYGVVSLSGGTLLKPSFTNSLSAKVATHLEYFEGGQLKTESYGFVTHNTNDVFGTNKQHGLDFETADDYGYNNALKHQFFSDSKQGKSTRASFEHVLLKAAGSDNYADTSNAGLADTLGTHVRDVFAQTFALTNNLHFDGRRNKFTITYVNGLYAGIYDLREPFETSYINHYYNVLYDSIDNMQTTSSNAFKIESGSDTAWVTLYNFIVTKSMTNVAYYNYVESKLDFNSLIDFMIYNSYMINADFLNNNVALWQSRLKTDSIGKWKYAMVNMDNIYGFKKGLVTGITSPSITTGPCAYNTSTTTAAQSGHAAIVEKLMTNQKFKDLYINRFSELLTTTLTCDKLKAHLAYLKTLLASEMPRHIDSLGNSKSTLLQWNKNIDTLSQRLSTRCNNIKSSVVDCYDLSGPYNLNITVFPPEANAEVSFDVFKSQSFPWSLNYFGDVNVKLKQRLIDTAKYEFSHWEFEHHIPNPLKPIDSLSLLIKTNDNIVVYYTEKYPVTLFPTGFSPNGDGNNDVLRLVGTRWVTDFMVEIWNRWGELVYSSTDVTSGWDGNFKGNASQTGVYGYVVKYTDATGTAQIKKGNVTLIR